MKNFLFYLILLFIIEIGYSQELRLRKGTIIDSIVLPDTNNETYALYLPKSFNMNEKWPIIFVFDPMAKGKKAINHFFEGAEKYQYIIAASNTIRNGSYVDNFKRAENLINTITSSFPVDMQRLYLAGFSGGSRLAITIASSSSNFKGVIACGAGFPSSTFVPSNNVFTYIGIAGDEDFNYSELKNAVAILKRKKYDANFVPFEGEHNWPPSLQIEKALRLFTLNAMNKGYVSMNENLIKALYFADYNYHNDLLNQAKYSWAYNDLKNLIKNYRFYVQSDSLNKKLKSLSKNNNYKIQKKNELEVNAYEKMILPEYSFFLNSDIKEAKMDQLGMWANEIDSLKVFGKRRGEAGNKMFKRLKNSLFVNVNSATKDYDEKEGLDNLLFANALLTIISPKHYDSYFKVIKYSVKKSEYGMALFYLEELLKNDFKDSQKLIDLKGISSLRISPEYNELLRNYGLETMY